MINKLFSNPNKSNFMVFLLVGYLIAAGCWWSYLLYVKNQDAWLAKIALLARELADEGLMEYADLQKNQSYQLINQKYSRQEKMIMGEGLVLIVLMIIGLRRVYNLHKKEELLQQQQQNFLLSITHELKSPLASVQLVLETMQKRDLSKEQQQKLTQHALAENERLKNHINAMLLSAKVEGGYTYSLQPLSLVQIAEELIEQEQLKYKGQIELLTTEDDCLIMADSLTMQTALSNLLENAIKYAADTAKIVVKVQPIGDKKVEFEVQDWGLGISKGEKNRIFDKFYRVGNEHTRQKQGTGLGLYIVKKVVEAHKGSITVVDNQPTGAIFKVVLDKYIGEDLA
jgi:signal transduction histidine kinase